MITGGANLSAVAQSGGFIKREPAVSVNAGVPPEAVEAPAKVSTLHLVIVRPVPDGAVEDLLSRMGASDYDELYVLSGGQPGLCLTQAVRSSAYSFAVTEGAASVAVAGVTPGGVGWMVASTAGLERHKKDFLRLSRIEIDSVRRVWPGLAVYVDARQVKSLRWLGWLGFKDDGEAELQGRRVHRMVAA